MSWELGITQLHRLLRFVIEAFVNSLVLLGWTFSSVHYKHHYILKLDLQQKVYVYNLIRIIITLQKFDLN